MQSTLGEGGEWPSEAVGTDGRSISPRRMSHELSEFGGSRPSETDRGRRVG